MSDDDRKAKETVLAVLQDKALNMVDFTIGTRKISPELFQKVAAAITKSEITVMVAPNLLPSDVGGRYFQALTLADKSELYDLLVLRTGTLSGTVSEKFNQVQVIVHECTHAALDMMKIKGMNHLQHESTAYVTAARYMIEWMLANNGKPEKVTFKEKIETLAWKIALLQSDGEEVKLSLYHDLDIAIMKHPRYKDEAKKAVVNDGVGKTWKPAPPAAKKPGT